MTLRSETAAGVGPGERAVSGITSSSAARVVRIGRVFPQPKTQKPFYVRYTKVA